MLSIRDFDRRSKTSNGPDNEVSLGNIHLQLIDYENGGTVAHGIDLKSGEELRIALAGKDEFVKLYTRSDEDITIRENKADKVLAKRPSLDDFSAKRGIRAVPADGGVITFDDVRRDYDSGKHYARWLTGLVHIPDAEKALSGMFEIRQRIGKNASGQEFKTASIDYVDIKGTFDPLEGTDPVMSLDEVFSGSLPGTKGAPARTGALVSVQFPDGIRSFSLSSPRVLEETDGGKVYKTIPGIEAALNRELKGGAAVAATVLAAVIGRQFDTLKFSGVDQAMSEKLEKLHEAVQSGDLRFQNRVAVTPTATLAPSRFQNDAFMGIKEENGVRKEVRTEASNLVDRGFFHGVVGIRFISQKTNKVVEPVVKAIASDSRLPEKNHVSAVRLDLRAVGEMAISQLNQKVPAPEPVLDQSKNLAEDEHEEDISYDAPGNSF